MLMTSLCTVHDRQNVHVDVQQCHKDTLSLQNSGECLAFRFCHRYQAYPTAMLGLSSYECLKTQSGLNVAVQHIGDICTGLQQGDANKQLTSMRLSKRALWKVLLRSSPMMSGSYLSILVRNTRVGISAQHHAESSSHTSIDAVIK